MGDDGDGNDDDGDGGALLRAIMCDCGDCNCGDDQVGDPLDGG